MGIDISQFRETFLEESFEGLEVMEKSLLDMTVGASDADVINTIFRAAHSIKGGSATFGFADVATFTHVMETLLDQVRSGDREITENIRELLLSSVDCVRDMLECARNGGEVDREHVDAIKHALEFLLEGESSVAEAKSQSGESAGEQHGSGWKIEFAPLPHLLRTGNDPVRILRELAELGELSVTADLSKLPALIDMVPEDGYLSWTMSLKGNASETDVKEVFEWVDGDCILNISALDSMHDAQSGAAEQTLSIKEERASIAKQSEEKVEPASQSATSQARKKTSVDAGSIRVSTDKVDALINMVGELVITQSMLGELGENFDISCIDKLRDGLSELERNTRELQESVMRIRMLPISFAFNRFPRLVHDLSQKLRKKVELKMSGEHTELDKTVMEKIVDPLVHLIRNSLDHGIEQPETRKQIGKPEHGEIHLNAYHKGGNIVVEICDDGAGLDKEKILKKARENGLIDNSDLTDEKINDLIFHPGFSTADTVSDVSGRGVGMDVVKRNIKDLGGNIELESVPGEGSTFRIRLPLTLAIMDGQLVRVGNQIFIIPLVSIIESLQVEHSLINVIADKGEVYRLRDEYIRVVRLHDVLNLGEPDDSSDSDLLVVVEGDGKKIGLFVDDLLNQQQIVIKSLETNFKRVDGLSGATILGDGSVALIFDVAGLIQISSSGQAYANRFLQAV